MSQVPDAYEKPGLLVFRCIEKQHLLTELGNGPTANCCLEDVFSTITLSEAQDLVYSIYQWYYTEVGLKHLLELRHIG